MVKKFNEFSEEIQAEIIRAATKVTVAKINAKGAKFDCYYGHKNWFRDSISEVISGLKAASNG
ncbi:hypothetical protein SAMN05216522_12012 [Rosenbergiella nectarea]|uniref:Uncharacterized protein n=1 Tax=Rosenbergiella nectarea TaxID=988801 RepID=A0A1H9N043_9GAMM|nr:hypothetical protein [Rosenbergiella nectarea]SER29025.1 hypothetical protein SAMN05216522_12012 [Rosenbergiella nectarea]